MSGTAKEFWAYAIGLCAASVCSNLGPEDTEDRLNREHPTGIDSRWRFALAEPFRDGTPNPCPCPQAPDTHRHYLFHC